MKMNANQSNLVDLTIELEEKTKDNLSYIASCIYKESCPSFEVKIY